MSRIAAALLLLGGCASPPVAAPVDVESIPFPGGGGSLLLARVPSGPLAPFRMGIHEVTWAEYRRFEKAEDWHCEIGDMLIWTLERDEAGRGFAAPERPLAGIGWHTAVAYGGWLSRETGAYFRLPTEREWEQALGGAPPALDEVAWHRGNSGGTTHPPGRRKPTASGLYDLLGNVWEYALEWRDAPFGPVLRGGAWDTGEHETPERIRQPIAKDWYEADFMRPHSLRWLFGWAPSQGMRLVAAAGPEDREDRRHYARAIEIRILRTGEPETLLLGGTRFQGRRVTVEIRNGGDRTLSELEVEVHALTPGGKPHRLDRGGISFGRPTWMKAWPVLANGGSEPARRPLRRGEARRFDVLVPNSWDEEQAEAADRFGAEVTNLRFAAD